MSKKPSKTAIRPAVPASEQEPVKIECQKKKPSIELPADDTGERIARALEAIVAHLSAASRNARDRRSVR